MNQPILNNCPYCKSPLKQIPAGISQKTGKPYNSFIACSDRNCGYIHREDVPRPRQQGFQKAVGGNEEIMNALREIFNEIAILRKEFQDFARIFTDKNKEEGIEVDKIAF